MGPMSENPNASPALGNSPSMRASDADRRRVAAVLHEALGRGQLTIHEFDERTAAVWQTRLVSELEPLTADLVAPGGAARQSVERAGPSASERVTGEGGPKWSVAIMGGAERKGVWTVPAQFNAVAVMGGVVLDLRYANLGARQVTINAVAVMGGVDIIVPDDVVVREEGFGVMGSFADERRWGGRPAQPGPGAPEITVQGVALMGGVRITRKPSGPQRQIQGN